MAGLIGSEHGTALVIFGADRILLMPAVADRAAYLWNKKAVASTNFEVVFTISGSLPKGTQQAASAAALVLGRPGSPDLTGEHHRAIVEQALRDKGQDWCCTQWRPKAGLKSQGYSVLANKCGPQHQGCATELMTEEWVNATANEVRVFPKGNVVISKRDLGVSHIPGSEWSWAPDGNEARRVVIQGCYSNSAEAVGCVGAGTLMILLDTPSNITQVMGNVAQGSSSSNPPGIPGCFQGSLASESRGSTAVRHLAALLNLESPGASELREVELAARWGLGHDTAGVRGYQTWLCLLDGAGRDPFGMATVMRHPWLWIVNVDKRQKRGPWSSLSQ
eukprot:Skav209320  [mRNA]  locus=scaffold994:656800:666139:- [translate_table: standard]